MDSEDTKIEYPKPNAFQRAVLNACGVSGHIQELFEELVELEHKDVDEAIGGLHCQIQDLMTVLQKHFQDMSHLAEVNAKLIDRNNITASNRLVNLETRLEHLEEVLKLSMGNMASSLGYYVPAEEALKWSMGKTVSSLDYYVPAEESSDEVCDPKMTTRI